MKVLLVHKFWRKVGGAENYFQDVARILRDNGATVKIFTTNLDSIGSAEVYQRDQDVIFGEYKDYLHDSFFKKMISVPEIIYSKKNKELFGKVLDDFRPDIVHAFAIFTTITPSILDACSERNIPVVMSCNDYKHVCPNYLLYHHGRICEECKGGKFYRAVVNNCCKHSVGVSIVSSIESYYHQFNNSLRKNVSLFLFEGRFMMNKTKEFWDEKSFRSAYLGKPFHAPAYAYAPSHENFILYVGRLSPEKGADRLIRAMKNVPEAKLKITGDGGSRAELEQLCKELNLSNVEFTGPLYGDDLLHMMQQCRFVVIPSVCYENFPYVLAESFAIGKTVIGSDKGGIPEHIENGKTGYIYPSDDIAALSDRIQQLWQDDAKCIAMGKAAKQYADENFNDTIFYRRLESFYRQVLEGKEKISA